MINNIEVKLIKIQGQDFFFKYRKDSETDIKVINQIFSRKDYDISVFSQSRKLFNYHNQKSKIQQSLIIDAGANIGASAVYFSKNFPNSFVFTIEPDIGNQRILEMNTKELDGFYFTGAIADSEGTLILENLNQGDWGFSTRKTYDSDDTTESIKVQSICPSSILSHAATENKRPLILKIDIEGGEELLFSGDTAWLGKFPLVIIELHDWMLPFSGSSRNFIRALALHDFDFLYKGENIFLFNRKILWNY